MALDLDRDITINGHTFAAGKGVDTKATDTVDGKAVTTDYADGIKENLKVAQEYDAQVEADKAIDPLAATKAMNGIDQPNPVTEAAAPTDPIVPIETSTTTTNQTYSEKEGKK